MVPELQMMFTKIVGKVVSLFNHFSIFEFESFCEHTNNQSSKFRIGRKVFHRGNWKTTCKWLPNLRAGLAIYELIRN